MVSTGTEYHLGGVAFFMIVLRRITLGVLCFIAVITLLLLGNPLASIVAEVGKQAGMPVDAGMVTGYALSGLAAIGLLLCLAGLLIAALEYWNLSYRLNDFDLVMGKGILDRTETAIPYRQMQDVDIARPLAYRLFGLSKIVFQTAGHEEPNEHGMTEIVLEPIGKDRANEIRTLLGSKIGIQIVKEAA